MRTYRIRLTYDETVFAVREINARSRKAAIEQATTQFLRQLQEEGYPGIQPDRIKAEVIGQRKQ